MLNEKWLFTFVNLVQIKHFGLCAKKLFMTQPGVSQHIKNLEKSCGYQLISRFKKSFSLTNQGKLLYEYAIEQQKKQALLFETLSFDSPFSGVCKIACSGACALFLYSHILDLQVKYPELIIKLEVTSTKKILSFLDESRIDFALLEQTPSSNNYNIKPLGLDEICLFLPSNLKIKKNLFLELKKLGFIDHPDAYNYLQTFITNSKQKDLLNKNMYEIPIKGYINQLTQILIPVAKGIGFTVLPKSVYQNFEQKEKIRIFLQKNKVLKPVFLALPKNSLVSKSRQMIIDSVIKLFQEEGKSPA